MDEIKDIRRSIDEIDRKMLELLNKRAELALQIKKTGLGRTPIRPEREASIVHDLTVNNPGPLPDKAVREIFTQIIASFRDRLQLDRPISVSYLGPAGTYSEEAALKLFGSTVDLHAEETILEVIRSVDAGSSNLAVVPIENSTEGAVRETHKLLQDTNSKIVAEISLPILHCLLTNCSSLDKIKTVYAHPQALGQC
ncbi:MAG TPA: prephenate dehydratase domain-containing protein, partial [Patescibacteria group bacterium]|nr:prephenate dehydratase domain-containing protein [Patescibacteria group bacterium]